MSRSFVVKWSKCNLYNHLRNNAVQGLYGHNKQWYSLAIISVKRFTKVLT